MSAARFPMVWKTLPVVVVATLSVWATSRLIKTTTPPSLPVVVSPIHAPRAPVPFLQKWCYDCHGDGASKGDFSMDGPVALTDQDWDKIRRHVLLRTMPPDDKPAPPPDSRTTFEEDLLAWQATLPGQSAPVPFRRLSRREFAASLEDLIGTGPSLGDLPEDESAHGFDNNGDFQPLPPTVLERYGRVIQETLHNALLPAPVPVRSWRYMAPEFDGPGGPSPDAPSFYEIETAHPTRVPVTLTAAGSYRITLRAYAHQAGEGPVQVVVMQAAPQSIRSTDRTAPDAVHAVADLPSGASFLTFHLANPLHDAAAPDPHRRTRRLLVQELAMEGPLDGDTTPTAAFAQRFGPLPRPGSPLADRVAWLSHSVVSFARRAWRRPPAREESSRLLHLGGDAMAHGLRDDEALAIVLQAILTSPHFLFLPDPARTDSSARAYAVAARLSYLLWSTLPDETLRAESATPWTPARLATTARRLLDDPRASAFARDFAGQWLQLRNTALTNPDSTLFPEVSTGIRQAMQQSAETFFLHLLRENEPVLRLLDADYTFLNVPLARWAGLPLPQGETGFQKHLLTNPDRFGLLGHPAVLLLTSYPNRTSPVLRGKYILEALLGLDPPPPPPNVPTLQAAGTAGHASQSVRAALEHHRADRACASCHRAIDPLGFPLEAFDAIGRPRGVPAADLTTTTFTGATLHSPADLHAWLVETQGLRIVNHVTEQLLTYAHGRGLTAAEIQGAHRLAAACGAERARFRDLLLALISSSLFRGENNLDHNSVF